jgi:hypothetical protein
MEVAQDEYSQTLNPEEEVEVLMAGVMVSAFS